MILHETRHSDGGAFYRVSFDGCASGSGSSSNPTSSMNSSEGYNGWNYSYSPNEYNYGYNYGCSQSSSCGSREVGYDYCASWSWDAACGQSSSLTNNVTGNAVRTLHSSSVSCGESYYGWDYGGGYCCDFSSSYFDSNCTSSSPVDLDYDTTISSTGWAGGQVGAPLNIRWTPASGSKHDYLYNYQGCGCGCGCGCGGGYSEESHNFYFNVPNFGNSTYIDMDYWLDEQNPKPPVPETPAPPAPLPTPPVPTDGGGNSLSWLNPINYFRDLGDRIGTVIGKAMTFNSEVDGHRSQLSSITENISRDGGRTYNDYQNLNKQGVSLAVDTAVTTFIETPALVMEVADTASTLVAAGSLAMGAAKGSAAAAGKALTNSAKKPPKTMVAGCFVAGTLVCIYRSENADQKELIAIENVQPGEHIWSCDPRTEKWTPKTVLQVLTREYSGDIIKFSYDGGIIEATGNHPVWIVDGNGLEYRPKCRCLNGLDNDLRNGGRWVEARDLRVGDLLRGRLGETVRILNVESRFEETIVYNFDIDDFHTYAVGSYEVLVHNSSMEPVSKATSTVWQNFEPFRGQTKTNGLKGSNKRYYEWDYTHNHIEVYNSVGKHMGEMCPKTGKMIGPAKERWINIK